MQETELNLMDLLCCILRKWRMIIIFAVICAILLGAICAVNRVVKINDEEEVQRWKDEYEVAYGAYWAAIYDVERQISENERLAIQAETKLSDLDRQKMLYEAQIEDIEGEIEYNKVLIEAYNANKEHLINERDKLNYYLSYRKEQNENSLLMKIDPYNVNVHEVYLRIDSGYEIIPGNTYQNTDPTAELLQTYRLLVSKTNFYDEMIADLNLNTEVRYLTEVVSVSNYNDNSICIRVVSEDTVWATRVANYIADELLASRTLLVTTIAKHDITKYNSITYSTIDLSIFSKQQSYIQEALSYEESIRNVDKSIFSNESAVRDVNADIRSCETQIIEINHSIDNLPLEKQAIENKINGYYDANYTLKEKRMELLGNPEPQYKGYTSFSVFTGFVKFAILGGVIGAVMITICIAVVQIFSGKALSHKHLCDALQCEFFGYWPQKRKKTFKFFDRWLGKLAGNVSVDMEEKTAVDLVAANLAIACGNVKKLMLCGGADKKIISEIAEVLKTQAPNVDVICGTTLSNDPAVVRGLAECDAMVLVEQVDKSAIQKAIQLKNRAKSMDKPLLGTVVY